DAGRGARDATIIVGLHAPPKPPLYAMRAMVYAARALRLDSFTVWDHFQDLFPEALWGTDFTWLARDSDSPHEMFDYQTLLGYLAAHAGRLRLGVTVTEPVRRHPVLLAQAMLTLAHVSKKAPILGIGSGEAENIVPYGLPFDQPVGRLEEALQILRLCFDSHGPLDFQGTHFNLDHAFMDLPAPKRRKPAIWVAAHGPRMLRLAGQYGDGWYPTALATPADYAAGLEKVHAAAVNAGRDPARILPAFQAHVVVAPSMDEARRLFDSKPMRMIAILAPAAIWRQFGQQHPFGDDFRGMTDFIPSRYSAQELNDALAAVPIEVAQEAMIWGTPERVTERLRDFGAAGLRYVVIEVVSAAVSPKAAGYSLVALRKIAGALR
ncbi:MAG TPA: LLM class flavin-dependent oxidoreductase, partial [Thermomicrobiales bacterium]|nr:LLM class flavin-dependent oxidoreductase [Thermomicrobiales bacterium]